MQAFNASGNSKTARRLAGIPKVRIPKARIPKACLKTRIPKARIKKARIKPGIAKCNSCLKSPAAPSATSRPSLPEWESAFLAGA